MSLSIFLSRSLIFFHKLLDTPRQCLQLLHRQLAVVVLREAVDGLVHVGLDACPLLPGLDWLVLGLRPGVGLLGQLLKVPDGVLYSLPGVQPVDLSDPAGPYDETPTLRPRYDYGGVVVLPIISA